MKRCRAPAPRATGTPPRRLRTSVFEAPPRTIRGALSEVPIAHAPGPGLIERGA